MLKILVVNDVKLNLKKILLNLGHDVTYEGSPLKVLERIDLDQFDVIVIDIEMDGRELRDKLSELKIPARFIAYKNDASSDLMKEGFHSFLSNPCDMARAIKVAYCIEICIACHRVITAVTGFYNCPEGAMCCNCIDIRERMNIREKSIKFLKYINSTENLSIFANMTDDEILYFEDGK